MHSAQSFPPLLEVDPTLGRILDPVDASHERTLTDLVYQALRKAITNGKLDPGYRLREIPLSRHFRVSTTPVREALRRLEREGLVAVSPHRGAVVAFFSLPQIIGLYEVRELLECRGVRRAAEAAPHDLSRIDTLLAKMEEALRHPDAVEFYHLDVTFHRALNDLSGNIALAELAERVHRQIQAVRVRCSVHLSARPAASHTEHLGIVAAVKTGDPVLAETRVRDHITLVCAAVVEAMRKSAEAQGP